MHANVRRLIPGAHSLPLDHREEAVREAVELVRGRTGDGGSHASLLADFLEDDLRECRGSLEELNAWFDDVLELVSSPETPAVRLIDQADDSQVLEQVEYLQLCVSNLRKRLLQVAAKTRR